MSEEKRKQHLVEGGLLAACWLISHPSSNLPLFLPPRPVIKRSLPEARSELSELRSMILSSAPTSLISTFKSRASEESDCSSAKKGGDLGFFEFKKMKRNFSEVAFKLSVNGISELVETSSGVHLICRLE